MKGATMIAKARTSRNNSLAHAHEMDSLRAEIAELKEGLTSNVHDLGANGVRVVRSAASAARAAAEHLAERGSDRARLATKQAQDIIVERPFTSVAIAAGAGAVLAATMILMWRRA